MRLLLELPYLPPVPWLSLFVRADKVHLEACEHFTKGTFRNRCHIAGPNGMQRLSIPLRKGKHQQMPIREVRIAYDESWQQVHWRSIVAAYGNAPYFEYWSDDFARFFEKKFEFLFDFNLEILQMILQKTGIATPVEYSQMYVPKSEKLPGDFRDAVSPKSDAWPEWFHPQPYPQVFGERFGFQPGLSSLDLLFCCGKQSAEVLRNSIGTFPGQFGH